MKRAQTEMKKKMEPEREVHMPWEELNVCSNSLQQTRCGY
jgi:hypothetical protein